MKTLAVAGLALAILAGPAMAECSPPFVSCNDYGHAQPEIRPDPMAEFNSYVQRSNREAVMESSSYDRGYGAAVNDYRTYGPSAFGSR